MKILAIGAHPDDVELLCGGTLALYAGEGNDVTIAYACRGDKGHFKIEQEELARIRAEEAKKAARVIGARSIGLGIDDLELRVTRECTMPFVDLIRQTRPDVIITHSPNDYMPDHTVTSRLVFDASFIATLPHAKTDHRFYDRITPIYHMDTLAGLGFEPEEYVDISSTIDTKLEMLSMHRSQEEWLKEHDNIDVLEFARTVSAFRGLQCGVKYAEGFRRVRTWPRNRTRRYLP